MKLKEEIFNESGTLLKVAEIYYDEQVTKGLFLVGSDKYIKRNIKLLNIDLQIPNDIQKLGVRYSKKNNFVVVSIVVLDEDFNKHKMQYILKDSCTIKLIENCSHYVLRGVKEVLINGLDLLKVQTLEDAINWTDKNK